jgi:photosystem II stability/assembly factor-like uncharacterized protein
MDGGVNWIEQSRGTRATLNSVHFISPDTGWAAGLGGTIVKTMDGGANWVILNSGVADHLEGVHFVNRDTGFAAGRFNTGSATPGVVLKTVDGGANWAVQRMPNNLYDVYFVNAAIGFAVGSPGPGVNDSGVVFKTVDGGATWTGKNVPRQWINAIHCVDANRCWAGSDYYPDLSVSPAQWANGLRTVNGGATWTPFLAGGSFQDIRSVFFVDANTGWAGTGNLLKTANGGLTWTLQDSGLAVFHFTDASTGWAYGGAGCKKTLDGGATWTPLSGTCAAGADMYFPTPSVGYMVGGLGAIWKMTVPPVPVFPRKARDSRRASNVSAMGKKALVFDARGRLIYKEMDGDLPVFREGRSGLYFLK